MKTREKILKILKTNLPYLNERYGVCKTGKPFNPQIASI